MARFMALLGGERGCKEVCFRNYLTGSNSPQSWLVLFANFQGLLGMDPRVKGSERGERE